MGFTRCSPSLTVTLLSQAGRWAGTSRDHIWCDGDTPVAPTPRPPALHIGPTRHVLGPQGDMAQLTGEGPLARGPGSPASAGRTRPVLVPPGLHLPLPLYRHLAHGWPPGSRSVTTCPVREQLPIRHLVCPGSVYWVALACPLLSGPRKMTSHSAPHYRKDGQLGPQEWEARGHLQG